MIGCEHLDSKDWQGIQGHPPMVFNWRHTMKLELKNLQFKIKEKNLEDFKKFIVDNFM